MIELTHIKDYEQSTMEDFFGDKMEELTDRERLMEHGHIVTLNGEQQGFVALVPVEEGSIWLRSLYFQSGVRPELVLTLFEVLQQHVEEQGLGKLFVFSHQRTLEPLLETYQYQQIDSSDVPVKDEDRPAQTGNWWCYTSKAI
ncbi:hypothetical protein IMZ31_17600 [Pontibacillus sp. ALD_SL1]|uniref:hypothetical protein n=1 Tax=Pontibacillus sp. ALD_SL1 TaxID=2777185 RepID=UPI001A963123|nr:hypothetical protein [Pontibacillus sp. ALD_SL1]QSS99852.1 hypothetical protein IMZ31_17600 [Pontibacillus sp. ALD_SL1]